VLTLRNLPGQPVPVIGSSNYFTLSGRSALYQGQFAGDLSVTFFNSLPAVCIQPELKPKIRVHLFSSTAKN